MPKAKKFIDRKSAVTFNLVHRSQRDPLAADDTAPQRVLVPVNANVPETSPKQPNLTPEQRRSEQQKYGIYFDDDYNYLQHLRNTKEVTMLLQPKATHKRKEKSSERTADQESAIEHLQLPSSVFASQVEEDVGLLNKAAPQGLRLDLDPDVVAALDEDFDYDNPDNELEDNFMELAMGEGSEDEYSEEEEESEARSDKSFPSDQEYDSDDDSQESEGGLMPKWDKFGADETKSRFSQYSMSSSVMRRNQGLDLLDHRFEKMFAEYDDTELGALDCEEIEGTLPASHEDLLHAAEEFQAQRALRKIDKEKEMARLTRMQEITEESSEEEMTHIQVEGKEKWDCESILTTYSNLYNRPKLIEEPKKPSKIQINAKTGIPFDIHTSNKLTAKSLARFNAETAHSSSENDDVNTHAESILSTLSVLSIRPNDESQEEKRERKRLLKEYRKERRIEKKANKEVFKEEKKRQEKIMLNNKNNIQGNRIL